LAIVGIIGKKGSGKSECSKVLVNKHGFRKISFADKLKEVVSELWDIPIKELYDPSKKETFDPRWGKTYREIMQLFGTEVCRNIAWNTWLYHVEKEFKRGDNWIVDDVRFKNEAQLIKMYRGILIKVVRPILISENDQHQSEVEQDQIKPDVIIMNNYAIKDLHRRVEEVVTSFF